MEFCSCPSPQFVCHAAHGCVCRVGFTGTDCLTPRGLYKEPDNGGFLSINTKMREQVFNTNGSFALQVKAVQVLHGVCS